MPARYTNSFQKLNVKTIFKKNLKIWSNNKKKTAANVARPNTINEPVTVSFFVGQVILNASCFTSCKNLSGFLIIVHSMLAGAEGIEPPTSGFGDRRSTNWATLLVAYLIILVTTPAPTVLPPSLIAKLSFSLMAIGVISLTLNFASSPGIIISVPDGSVTSPVTSVVLK